MASATHAQVVAEPLARSRSRRKAKPRPRARGGILWIAISGILLAGVVFVNVAVLRLNINLDSANQQRVKLRAQNATLQSELASALASPRIQNQARTQDGLVTAGTIHYLNIGK